MKAPATEAAAWKVASALTVRVSAAVVPKVLLEVAVTGDCSRMSPVLYRVTSPPWPEESVPSS